MAKILSIDWDYFIDADNETRSIYFPDQGDKSGFLASFVWSSYYFTTYKNKPKIEDIGIHQKEYDIVMELLKKQPYYINWNISSSHLSIYEWLEEIEDIELYHIDYHHDIFDINYGVDCGNWLLRWLERDGKINKVTWIKQEDSDMPYKTPSKMEITTDINVIKDQDFVAIFLTRSDIWSPPHLDKYFVDMAKELVKKNYDNYSSDPIFKNRFNEEFITRSKMLAEQTNKFNDLYEKQEKEGQELVEKLKEVGKQFKE